MGDSYYQIAAPCKHCQGELDHIPGGYVHRTAGHPVRCPGGQTVATPDWRGVS